MQYNIQNSNVWKDDTGIQMFEMMTFGIQIFGVITFEIQIFGKMKLGIQIF